jgi:hypothetical protein
MHEQIPPGHVWIQGDNLPNSTDSRAYGPVSMNLLTGRAFAKVRERTGLVAIPITIVFFQSASS